MLSFLIAFLCSALAQLLLLVAFATDGKWISIVLLTAVAALYFLPFY